MLFYLSAKMAKFFYFFAKAKCLQKIWFMSYSPKISKQITIQDSFKVQYLTKNLRYEVAFLYMTRGGRKH